MATTKLQQSSTMVASSSSSGLLILAKRGDVILKLGDSRLLVSSAVLSVASDVFEAMFYNQFAEAQNLSPSNPREVPLPDDNPSCMTILCKIIHTKNKDIPLKPDLDILADLALICDKYNCVEAVQPWLATWLSKWTPHPEAPGYGKLLFITYVLDSAEGFYQATKKLVHYYAEPPSIECATHNHDFLPINVLETIGQDQQRLQKQAMAQMQPKEIIRLLTPTNCNKADALYNSYFKMLLDVQLFPITMLSLSQYDERVGKLKWQNFSADKGCGTPFSSCPCNSYQNIKTSIMSGIIDIINSVRGQCLDCLNRELGKTGVGLCRITH